MSQYRKANKLGTTLHNSKALESFSDIQRAYNITFHISAKREKFKYNSSKPYYLLFPRFNEAINQAIISNTLDDPWGLINNINYQSPLPFILEFLHISLSFQLVRMLPCEVTQTLIKRD